MDRHVLGLEREPSSQLEVAARVEAAVLLEHLLALPTVAPADPVPGQGRVRVVHVPGRSEKNRYPTAAAIAYTTASV